MVLINVPPHPFYCRHVYIYRLQYDLSAESVELHLTVTMELRQRILDLYHQFSLSGLDVSLNLWYRGGQEFFTLTDSPLPLSGDSLSSGWNQEKQKTQTQNRNRRRRIKRRIEILRPINGTPGAVSAAVPDLGAVQPKPLEWS